jgi:hypothetical protein
MVVNNNLFIKKKKGGKSNFRNDRQISLNKNYTSLLKDAQSVKEVIKTVNQFSILADPKLNLKKSKCILLRSLKNI